ncbi:MAG TPA: glycosyltransferase, partial [Bryobacteraceae bacterium]|nr:glycosyltransferase [Bryobacteraceae bacterium]
VSFPPGLVDRVLTLDLSRHSRSGSARLLRNGRRLARRVPPLIDRFAGFGDRIAAFLEGRPCYDVGMVEHFWCAPYLEQIEAKCGRTFLDLHNIESDWHMTCRQLSRWPSWLAHDRFYRAALDLERCWLSRYDCVLATSEADAGRVRRIAPAAAVSVYPNAIPLRPAPRRHEQNLIAFSGTLDYEPNRAAVRYFADGIWPGLRRRWPHLGWRLIGRHPEAVEGYLRGLDGVEYTGPVGDAIPYLAEAKAAVVPILSGSGTRLKIIEAWAAGTPVVSTSKGAEGLNARDGEEILLADDPAAFVDAVSRLVESPDEALRIGLAGRERYRRDFTWPAAWKALDLELGVASKAAGGLP